MTKRRKIWLGVAVVFTLINAGGWWWAARLSESMHAAVHVGLTILGGYLVWRLGRPGKAQEALGAQPVDERLVALQQSVDAVAIEVERIGEAQRFNTRIRTEREEEKSGS